jgi:hypothetical protein
VFGVECRVGEVEGTAGTFGDSYVDGGITPVPRMIGRPGSLIRYSGSRPAFDAAVPLLEVWSGARFLGTDPACSMRAGTRACALIDLMRSWRGPWGARAACSC